MLGRAEEEGACAGGLAGRALCGTAHAHIAAPPRLIPADEHGRPMKRPAKDSTSPRSPQAIKQPAAPACEAAANGPAAPAAPAPEQQAGDGGSKKPSAVTGGSSENGKSGLGGSHDTERLVDAMMSDAAGNIVQ